MSQMWKGLCGLIVVVVIVSCVIWYFLQPNETFINPGPILVRMGSATYPVNEIRVRIFDKPNVWKRVYDPKGKMLYKTRKRLVVSHAAPYRLEDAMVKNVKTLTEDKVTPIDGVLEPEIASRLNWELRYQPIVLRQKRYDVLLSRYSTIVVPVELL